MANPLATWTELVLLTQQVIQGLHLGYGDPLTVLPPEKVYAFKFATDGYRLPTVQTGVKIDFPCVQVALGRMEDVANSLQDFENTTVIYPVLVVILFASNKTLALNNDLLFWRQRIYDAFADIPDSLNEEAQGLVESAVDFDCQITAQPVKDLQAWQAENLDFSWLVLNYSTTHSRKRR